jgi:hypothetical protein
MRASAENRSYLQGVASNIASPNLTLLGVTVVTNPSATQYSGADGGSLNAAAFFTQAAGKTVKVRGAFMGGVLTADQAQIKQ